MNKKINIGGAVLIILGSIFFLNNFIDIPGININWSYIWPLILIFIGVRLIMKKYNK